MEANRHLSSFTVAYGNTQTFRDWLQERDYSSTISDDDSDISDVTSVLPHITDNDETYYERFQYTCMIIGIYVKSIFRFLKNTFTTNPQAKNKDPSFDHKIEYRLNKVNDILKYTYSLPYDVWDLESGVELVNLCYTRYETSLYNK
jgi:hypothetical protein